MRILIYLILVLVSSCINVDTNPRVYKNAVVGIISPSDSVLSIFVSNYYTIGEAISLDAGLYNSKAKVVIYSETDSLQLHFNPQTNFYEVNNNGFIKASKTYKLRVTVENETITASTIIPDDHTITINEIDSLSNIKSLTMAWEKTANPAYYNLSGSVSFDVRDTQSFSWGSFGSFWKTSDELSEVKKILSPLGSFSFPAKANVANVKVYLQAYNKETFELEKASEIIDSRTDLLKRLEPPVIINSNLSNNNPGFFGSYTKSEINIKMKK